VTVSFLTPFAAAVGLVVVLAFWARLAARRRAAKAATALGLAQADWRGLVVDLALLGLVGALVALAAAQPVVSRSEATHGRDGAEVLVVFDVTRSMLARRAPSEPTRLDRARAVAKRLRAAIPETRVGVASLTDRVLPHLFPTFDEKVFAATVRHSIGIERPPPTRRRRNTTILAALNGLGTQGFFPPTPERRIAVVLSDFETEPFAAAALGARLRRQRVELLLVHVWNEQERIFGGLGDADYRPDPASNGTMARLSAGAGADAFGEAELGQARAALREQLGDGTRRPRWQGRSRTELAPWLALAAFIPVGFVLWRRNLGT
jgi:hypothetical protein